MMKRILRQGYTTGACAAAAAKGAALMLTRQEAVAEVVIDLPAGIQAVFELHGQEFGPGSASCFVVKDAGDDPDVTDGVEVHARVTLTPPPLTGGGWGVGEANIGNNGENGDFPPTLTLPHKGGGDILIIGGAGIGRVTKPGLAVPPGEWAINPVPRRMITEAVLSVISKFIIHNSKFKITVAISIPDGEERAKRTLNARLGIVGGLSILGTSGIVRPISAKAWTDTIDAALDVARACGSPTVVLSTGRTSELAAQRLFEVQRSTFDVECLNLEPRTSNLEPLPEEAYVMMGDHLAHALRACAGRGFTRPLIACQFAKLLKIACGHENTHAAASELDLAALRRWTETEDVPPSIVGVVARANTAREIALESGFDGRLLGLICRRAQEAATRFAPSLRVEFLLADYGGNIVFRGA